MKNDTNSEIDKLIFESGKCKPSTVTFKAIVDEIMEKLYQSTAIYTVLSASKAEMSTMTSIPFVSTKDRYPALYLFTSPDKALAWCHYYNHFYNKRALIAKMEKEDQDFRQLFPIAIQMGVEMIMLNEGGAWINLSLKDFVKKNNISMSIYSKDQADNLLGEKGIELELPHFNIL